MIVLDTDVVSELMRADPRPGVLKWVDKQAASTLFLTSLNLAEIRYGLAALPPGKRRSTLIATFEDGIRPMFGDRVLDFDEPASKEYAALRATARSTGQAISDADALIAAIARAHRYAVATRDVRPFEAARVHVINPFR